MEKIGEKFPTVWELEYYRLQSAGGKVFFYFKTNNDVRIEE